MQQHKTNPTVDSLASLYWKARYDNSDALADAIGLALDAAIEAKADEDRPLRDLLPLDSEAEPTSWADIAKCGHRKCRTRCHLDDAPAHGIPRPRFALAFCYCCRTIGCECM